MPMCWSRLLTIWSRRSEAVLLVVIALLASGCATKGVRPPSPAREVTVESLLALDVPKHEHYYILVFGSQRPLKLPRSTHTWATVVKTVERPGRSPEVAAVDTISWMPATLKINPWRTQVEKGINLDLRATMEEMLRQKECISVWGPYETWIGLYRRFLTQKAFLDQGAISYQCVDEAGEAAQKANGSNCFHALTDMDLQFDRRQYPLLWYGQAASENIVRQLSARPLLIRPRQTHDWLIPAIGLDRYPIVRRQYEGPAREFSREAIRKERLPAATQSAP